MDAAAQPRGRVVPVLAVIAVAALLRLWNIGGQPVLYFDSGVYLGEGAFLASAAERAAAALVQPGTGGVLERVARATEQGTDAHPPDIAKPGHAVLLALSMLVLGKSALAGALVSAVAGVGTVVVTCALGVRGWNQRVGVAAALLLAVSGQALVYSREALVESDGMFFAALASLVYLRARRARALLLAGAVFGLAFACNNRLGYLPLVLLLVELGCWRGLGRFVRNGVALAAGFGAPLALIEVGYLIARAIGRLTSARTDWLDYVQQLAAFSRMNPPDRWRFDQWPTYWVDLALMDGLAVLGLLLVGLGVLAVHLGRRRGMADVLLAASLLVPLALYSVYSTGEVRMRHFSLALPWVMLAAGLGLERLTRFSRWVLPSALGLLCVLAMPRAFSLINAPNGMPAVVAALPPGPVAGTNGPVLAFYVGEDRSNARLREAFVNVPGDLNALAQRYPTLVVDMQAYVFPGELTRRYDAATPSLRVPHGTDAWYLADLLEHYGVAWGGWDGLLATWDAERERATHVSVYNLGELTR